MNQLIKKEENYGNAYLVWVQDSLWKSNGKRNAEKSKQKLKKKVKYLTKQIKQGNISSKEANKYLCGHLGYIKIANTYSLEQSLFFKENEKWN